MKIIKDNTITENIKKKTYNIICRHCGSELEISNDDLTYGAFGVGYINCPCCGKKNENEYFDDIDLNFENLCFPQHYYCFKDGINLSNDEINEDVRHLLEELNNCEEEYGVYRFVGSGNSIIFCFKFEDEYAIYVCKDYYETSIPR